MSDENKLPAAADAQDTRTRKTVRLRPASAPVDTPVSDPLASRDTDTGNLEILDDTQTRKTLKLKPMSPGGTSGPKLNLSGAEDTQTRKTVLLRPANAAQFPGKPAPAQPATVRLDAEEVAAALEENSVEDQTRAVPRPAAVPGGIKLPAAAAVAAPKIAVPPAPQAEAEDQTSAVPRPAAAPGGIKLPAAEPQIATLPPSAKAETDDQTRAVPRPAAAPGGIKLPAAPAAEESADADDQTVKMKRPPRLGPPPMPAAAAATRPPVGGDIKATVKLNAPKPPVAAPQAAAPAPKPPTAVPQPPTAVPQAAAPAPKPPTAVPQPPTAVPQPPTAAPQAVAPTAPEAAEPEKAAAPKADEEISLAPSKRHQENAENAETPEGGENAPKVKAAAAAVESDTASPSLFYLILAVATLLFVACAGVITSVHYLYFEQQMDYREVISVLPNAK